MKKRTTFTLICGLIGVCALLFVVFYDSAEKTAIKQLNETQQIHAKQAAQGIEEFFATWTGILSSFSKMDAVIDTDINGKQYMRLFYEAHHEQIRSITRVDEKGRILYTVPHSRSIGSDISGQKHIREILRDHKPVVSDVFKTVQGFEAVALHVPVFRKSEFKGSVAIVLDFENLAKRYLDVIKIGDTGYAWLVSQDGKILYSPVPGFTGTSVFETYRDFPSVLSMARDMLQGRQGTTTYTFNKIGNQTVAPVKNFAVYMPIRIANTLWSIVVASSENEVLSSLASFRNRLILVIGAILIAGIVISFVSMKAWLIVSEEEKRKQAEEKLRESEELYRSVFENHSAVKFMIDPDSGRIIDANEAAATFYGWSREDLSQMRIQDINTLPTEEIKKEIEKATAEQRILFEFRHRRADGSIRDVEVFVSRIAVRGKVLLHSIIHDITDRKQAEVALREAEIRYHLLFDQSPDGIVIIDPGTARFLEFNERACAQLGYSREEFARLSIFDVEASEKPEDTEKRIAKVVLEGRNDFETMHRARQGEIRNVSVTAQISEILGRPVYHCVWRDITEHRKLEAQYLHAQKLESIGTFASGIAHDFNNILSAIIGYGNVALLKMTEDDPQRANIGNMLEAADRATQLTKDLLLFSRKQARENKIVDLNKVVSQVEKFLKRVIREDIRCKTIVPDRPLTVLADSYHIEQMLMNLATNARDAMPGGGTFAVQTGEVTLHEDFIAAHGYGKPGNYAMITVSDTGSGMDEATRMRIFEPFFTTKEVGKGTGLGLAVVYGIVKNHDGFINVYSEHGKGTTFRIYLPMIVSEAQEETASPLEGAPARGTETILLVEDDESVRRLSQTVLAEYGYRIIEAVDGEDAVRKFMENKESIQLLLLDLIMPKMNGKEAYDEIRKIKPEVKVLFASGYAPDIVQQKVSLEHGDSLIYKPVSPMALLRKVRNVLDGKNRT